MTNLAKSLRSHREAAKTRRALARALEQVTSPAERDDLIAAWQHADARR